jgi:hypothetical protein
LRKSSQTFLVGNYLVTLLLNQRNKAYTTTLAFIDEKTQNRKSEIKNITDLCRKKT